MHFPTSLSQLSDSELIAEVTRRATSEREAMSGLIASLAEFDARRLYLGEGCSSLFTYCTQVLHLSEQAAYGRIQAALAARRFPVILTLLTDGSSSLTTIGLLAPHLTGENHRALLEAARHKSKRDVEHVIASVRPQQDVAPTVRKLPPPKSLDTPPPQPSHPDATVSVAVPRPAPASPAGSRPTIRPLAPERFKVQFTVSRDTYEKLRRAQDLLRHTRVRVRAALRRIAFYPRGVCSFWNQTRTRSGPSW